MIIILNAEQLAFLKKMSFSFYPFEAVILLEEGGRFRYLKHREYDSERIFYQVDLTNHVQEYLVR